MIYWLCDAPKMLKQKSQSLTTQLHPTQWLYCYLAVKKYLGISTSSESGISEIILWPCIFLFTEKSVRVSKILLV